jgi:SAM-dependent methyltransferase
MRPEALPDVASVDYVARWAALVERRRAQMDGAYAASGQGNVDYWGRRAKNYRAAMGSRTERDPFFVRVSERVTLESTVIDVGAGTGRHTIALAPLVNHVTAVEPSQAMREFLEADASERGLHNVDVVPAVWMDADAGIADVVICSHVLYPIGDVVPFVSKLDASARERVWVYLRADPLPTELGLWSEFYGVPLQPQPVHMDLINVLAQIGIFADVEIVEHRFTLTFADLDEAVEQMRNGLCLREGDAAAETKLRGLLQQRLSPREDGRLGPEVSSARTAIMSWPGGSLRRQ